MDDPAVAAVAALVGVLVFCAYLLAIDRIQRKAFSKQMGSRQAGSMPTSELRPPQASTCSAGTSRIEQPTGLNHGGMHETRQSYQQQQRRQQRQQQQQQQQQQAAHARAQEARAQEARTQEARAQEARTQEARAQEARVQEARAQALPADAAPRHLDSAIRPVDPDATVQRGAPSLQPFTPGSTDTAYFC